MQMAPLLLTAALLTACGDPKGDTGTPSPDDDRDGYTVADGDCDDADPAVNPGAAEVCDDNDEDEDCSGAADDEDEDVDPASLFDWYADADADGFGDPDTSVQTCEIPDAHVANDTDCDDLNEDVNPDVQEVCDDEDVDEDCDGLVDDDDDSRDRTTQQTWYPDLDGDGYGDSYDSAQACDQPSGYVEDASDCDDARDDVSPAGLEICDDEGADEDCDGLSDDEDDSLDESTLADWYADDDSDGYGDAATTVAACVAPSGYLEDATDCDDARVDVNPGATEICDLDGTDEDCDGLVGEEDDSLDTTSLLDWYADVDGDGYGDAATTSTACEQPSGYNADATDCDDGDAAINPGATEICDPFSTDEDCDGLVDDDDSSVDPSTQSSWYDDLDADGWGDDASVSLACVQPSGAIATGGDCDDADADIHPGATEDEYDGVDSDCDGTVETRLSVDLADYSFTAVAQGDYGAFDLAGGDLDGDGLCDLVMSAPQNDDDASNAGMVYVFWATSLGSTADLSMDDADVHISGVDSGSTLGQNVAVIDDVTGDGVADLLAGSYNWDYEGGAFLFPGGSSLSGDMSVDDAVAVLDGGWTSGDLNGALCDAGDWDGDGMPDVMVGSQGSAGRVHVVMATELSGTYDLDSASWTWDGVNSSDYAYQGNGLGDVDGDGLPDLLVGAHGADGSGGSGAGAAYLLTGASFPKAGSHSLADADDIMEGEATNDYAGEAVAAPGDVDGDGYDDALVAAYRATGGASYSGKVYLVLASDLVGGTWSLAGASHAFLGEENSDSAGHTVASGGDLDGDGLPDLVIGAHNADGVATYGGKAYIVLAANIGGAGNHSLADADYAYLGTSYHDALGYGLANDGIGDVDGDGATDLILGGPYYADDYTGKAWLLLDPLP